MGPLYPRPWRHGSESLWKDAEEKLQKQRQWTPAVNAVAWLDKAAAHTNSAVTVAQDLHKIKSAEIPTGKGS